MGRRPLAWAIATFAAALCAFIASWITLGVIFAALPIIVSGHCVLLRTWSDPKKVAARRVALAGLVFGYAAAAISFVDAAKVTPSRESKAMVSLDHAKSLYIACKSYAIDHDGKFPNSLEDLIPEYIGDRTMLSDPKDPDKNEIGYLYDGGGRSDGDPVSTILITSKAVYRHGRVVVHVDGSGSLSEPPHPP